MDDSLLLVADDRGVEQAFRIARGDLFGNIHPWRGGPEDRIRNCILAGLDYDRPWTRDASLNALYAGSLVTPTVAQNTLLAVLTRDASGLRVGGQYWDAIVWVTAAWHHFLCTRDLEFLATALEVTTNTIEYFERTELDPRDGLFRGAAFFQDGIAGYPDGFADSASSCILDWVEKHPDSKASPGYGLPMKALSTNCLYYNAYRVASKMARALGRPAQPSWGECAAKLKSAINRRFWMPERGAYRYLVDAGDDYGRQEGIGHAFAILFGVAGEDRAHALLERQHITEHGIACVWPTYGRYASEQGSSFGRHSGTIWPQVNTAWCMAVARHGRRDLAWRELRALVEKLCRDGQCAEIYHPQTGEIYGGLQECPPADPDPIEWASCRRQSWCAAGLMQMILTTFFGLRVGMEELTLDPWLPESMTTVALSGLQYRNASVQLSVARDASGVHAALNGLAHTSRAAEP